MQYKDEQTTCISFGKAIEAMKQGSRVSRLSWNGSGLWIAICVEADYEKGPYNPSHLYFAIDGRLYRSPPKQVIVMKTADDQIAHWTASQTDILSEDWFILETNRSQQNLSITEESSTGENQ